MVFGMSLATYTLLHVLISLIAIASGVIAMLGWIASRPLDRWNGFFLATTALTSLTGFGFPFEHLLPSHVLGVLSLLALAVAIPARYVYHLLGPWRRVYVISASIALYFNVFVLIAQSFMKIPALKALAPTQKEPPFLITQLLVLVLFAGLIVLAARRFHVEPERIRARAA